MKRASGLIIAAPASGSGKTTVTLGILRALARRELKIAAAKVGPDFIDPRFHEAASGGVCVNLDPWAMRPALRARIADRLSATADLVIVEGVMGLYDGAIGGGGSTADLAAETGWPVIVVMDVSGMSGTVAALARGLRDHRRDMRVAGVIANRIAGIGHRRMIEAGFEGLDLPIIGAVPRDDGLKTPARHLGLVQANEHPELEAFIDEAADAVEDGVDLDALLTVAGAGRFDAAAGVEPVPPLGQRIAVARDTAFAFLYPHLLDQWRDAGADLRFFSPLADEGPDADADAVYLPGGYPELHAGRIAAAARFHAAMRAAAARGAFVYGECGGYMALGEGLVDAAGDRHAMLGLLPVETTVESPRLSLGYRAATSRVVTPLGPAGAGFRGHEFHYAAETAMDSKAALFDWTDSRGHVAPPTGRARENVCGSFLHIVDRV